MRNDERNQQVLHVIYFIPILCRDKQNISYSDIRPQQWQGYNWMSYLFPVSWLLCFYGLYIRSFNISKPFTGHTDVTAAQWPQRTSHKTCLPSSKPHVTRKCLCCYAMSMERWYIVSKQRLQQIAIYSLISVL